jgi:Fe2+ or Zn2+ uptake regulation protein
MKNKDIPDTDLKLAILRLLDDGRERTSLDVSNVVRKKFPGATPVKVSHQLRKLKDLGLVHGELICASYNVMAYRKVEA